MTMKTLLFASLGFFAMTAAYAGPRASANYHIATDSNDGGGSRSTSNTYTHDGGLADFAGVSTVAAPAQMAKAGYIAQLYEVTGLQLTATPATMSETGTRQLSAAELLDDLTTTSIPAGSIGWSILSGPLTNISSGGLVTAGTVYQNTAATVRGTYAGNTGAVGLTVTNSIADNFGTYANDGVGDDWQVQYFGLDNPNAAPWIDADFDGVLNLIEFATTLNPTLAGMIPMETKQTGSFLEFSYPRAKAALAHGLNFVVEWDDSLQPGSWSSIGVAEVVLSDNGTVQQVKATLPAGNSGRRFVRLRVVAP